MPDELEVIKEVAHATGEGLEVANKLSSFIIDLTGGTFEQAMGMVEDKLKYMRWERQIRLITRSRELMREKGLEHVTRPLSFKLAVPLLQAASLEDDDYLQDLWAKLLANAVDDQKVELRRTYIDILERLTPLEGRILEKIYSFPFDEIQHKSLVTNQLPDALTISEASKASALSNPEIELALIDLAGMGCISPRMTWGGGESFSEIYPTLLGKNFYDACAI